VPFLDMVEASVAHAATRARPGAQIGVLASPIEQPQVWKFARGARPLAEATARISRLEGMEGTPARPISGWPGSFRTMSLI